METIKPQPTEQNYEQSSKSFVITAPIPAVSHNDKPADIKPIPIKDGKPLVKFTPEMNSSQRQAVIIAKMNELRNEYYAVQMQRKKIMKQKKKMLNTATKNKIVVKTIFEKKN